LLWFWVRVPPGAWRVVSCECCVLSGRGLCIGWSLVQRSPPTECGVSECNREVFIMKKSWPTRGCYTMKKELPVSYRLFVFYNSSNKWIINHHYRHRNHNYGLSNKIAALLPVLQARDTVDRAVKCVRWSTAILQVLQFVFTEMLITLWTCASEEGRRLIFSVLCLIDRKVTCNIVWIGYSCKQLLRNQDTFLYIL
jgi:hypothetical protein